MAKNGHLNRKWRDKYKIQKKAPVSRGQWPVSTSSRCQNTRLLPPWKLLPQQEPMLIYLLFDMSLKDL